ncbi:TIGR02186 family protein [Pelagibacterales bacterium]|nr:TIGR02186 family protein [Pelagibacterales bacterium]
MKNILIILISLFLYQGNASALVIGSDLNEITIGANFSGQDLLVFGAFYSDPSLPRDAKGDVIIEVKGPPQTVKVRKKKSFYGFWLNNTEVTFKEVPGFYYLTSTTEINDEILNKNNITLLTQQDTNNIEWGNIRLTKDRRDFLNAMKRNKNNLDLFSVNNESSQIDILDGNLFKTNIPIPNTVPIGDYTVSVYLLINSELKKDYSYGFKVKRIGIESMIYNLAINYPLIYGLLAVLVAGLMGWISAEMFRRLRKA